MGAENTDASMVFFLLVTMFADKVAAVWGPTAGRLPQQQKNNQ
jgi:hypothetical protein